ncbi:NAD(P)H-hydrate dehydratase [Stenotrophomonas rhizophila]|uniref:NAD(P)H-hydrate dehydratase n=1 Tax=Stenotrophomonas rhizophila TaxID=216778 RepID=UPI001E36A447|nr:NAD(P)H-hydrate dehydratase [Stenotrophomonas rhizophila]MCC7632956.1 NAD(P)H-hydrate dehydratase [Stenotrophomonas rhizophila]MCC7662319.1 NAD(P)H-hydrate dehydratase [Stenotrophomonas rhizophila]
MPEPAELFDIAAARRIDAQASALLGDGGAALMEQAGQAAWQCLLRHWPQAQRICVLVGPGNNGGDGYVLARLARQAGRQVQVLRLPDAAPATPLAQRAVAGFTAAGGSVAAFDTSLPDADVLVDALYGLGLNRAPGAAAQGLIEAVNQAGIPVLALDVPSGVDADRGAVPGVAVRASVTVQFIVRHQGLYTGAALEHAGDRELAGLVLPDAAAAAVTASAQLWQPAQLRAALPPRRANTHKGESGHVLCVGGNTGSGGAVLLASEAVLRAGAGLVSVATQAAHVAPLLARLPEAMVHAVSDAQDLRALLPRAGVVAVGPGLGQDDWAHELWRLVRDSGKPLVVDADALNLLARDAQPLHDAILTPHPGEAARLLQTTTAQVQADRYAAAQALAERFHAMVVLKGAGTVIAAPQATPRVIAAGNPGMAVGGMGDLLTGIIAALRAQGLDAFTAASTGALLHGLAGDAAASQGQRGLLPTDLLVPLRRLVNPDR